MKKRIDVNNKLILVLIFILAGSVLLAGCTAPPGEVNKTNPIGSDKISSSDGKDTELSQAVSSGKESPIKDKESSTAGDSYYNIRIVPASVLESLQKEMGPEELLVHNDKGYTIGIVSPRGLVLRGDLMQLERESGSTGKDFDKTDVSLHLLDITYGLDNAKISLFKTNKDYKFWFDGYYSDSEIKYVKNLSRLMNSISGTTQFEDEEVALGFLQTNYEVVPNNYYNIKIVTEKMLNKFFDDRKETDHLIKDEKGRLIAIVNQDYLYLLNTLPEEDQKYYILKGLLYSMGLHGTSYKNKESFFYRTEGKNRELSELDIEAIKLLYGGGLKSGNTLEDARKTLGLGT